MYKAAVAFAVLLAAPLVALGHEVYVLDPEVVAHALTMPSLQVFEIIYNNTGQFFFWAFISMWAFFTILSISVSKRAERMFDPMLDTLKRYAPLAGRLTLGVAIMASGYAGALFGPELPFSDFLPAATVPFFKVLFMALGALITVGFGTRLAATLLIVSYLGMWAHYGYYMLTYANYFGEMILTLLVGNASFAVDRYFHHAYPSVFSKFFKWIEQRAFLILRVAFGMSLIFASLYAKLIYAQLALDTVTTYGLANYFPFDPPFIVLGAFAIELLLGLFFVFGIEIRFASLFLLFWLMLSLLYFGEAVWPHVILAGTAITIFMRGYDRHTLEWGLMHRHGKRPKEPVF